MICAAKRLPEATRRGILLFVVLFVLFFIVLVVIIVFFFGEFVLVILFLFDIVVFRDDVQMYWMRLRHFHFGLTLRTAQDLSLFHFVFIDIEFGSTVRTADHGHFLRSEIPRQGKA